MIGVAEFILSLWEGIKDIFASIGSLLDTILNPILSLIFLVLNPIGTFFGDVVYAILSPLPVWFGITFISIVTGVVMLIAFRDLSNQDAIGRAKDDIKANLLAMKLFKDELRVVFQSQVRLLGAIFRLQRYVLTPVLWMTLPMLLGLAQMGIRYQWRPLQPGEPVIIKAVLHESLANQHEPDVQLTSKSEITVEAGPVTGGGVTTWRISGTETGRHTLKILVEGQVIVKQLVVGNGFERVSALRPSRHWFDQLLHPVESALPTDSPVQSVEIVYPHIDSWVYGADYWVIYFFVVSMAAALILKPMFNVKF